ncbi:MAG: UTP--glucose-1-phosphate uridylyltransferase [Micavibrio aeruginosavorus]|uniref:UTP--glucose-1-phosphate uridylyltransferase n=1 Tax=Micavibrio aeruginosavorus TaxID=349221 RepID=A0A2W5A0M5_9BACT|nr:MAG: UTP--glucose-1-phosphate uridylyltransferase [Micavibrio aeruginosavorus]
MTNKHAFKPVRKAVFPVAGLGTRFLPATKVMPKEMLPLGDRPLIQHAVEEARDAGIEEFIFITGRKKEMLEEHFDYQPELMETLESRGKKSLLDLVLKSEMPANSLFTTRQAKPLGLGHAIWCAKKLVGDEPFAILLPDDVVLAEKGCMAQMIETYNEVGGNLVGVMDVPREETSKYGILDINHDDGKLVSIKGLVEKPEPQSAPSTLSIIGRYILQPEVFDYLSSFERGAGNEIQLTDSMAKLIGQQPFHGLRYDGTRFDCGSRLGFIEANVAYGLADKEISGQVRKILDKFR